MDPVIVSPNEVLKFDFIPNQEKIAVIELLNISDAPLNYKVKVTHTNVYKISNAVGVLAPKVPAKVKIEYTADTIPEEAHKFQVNVLDGSNPSFKFARVLIAQFTTKTGDVAELEYSQLKNDYESLTSKSTEVTAEVDNLHQSIDKHLKLRKEKQDDVLIKKPSTENFTIRALVLCFILGIIIGTFSGR
mmetsp:Transcript_24542/g.43408  ORF Transcript_24542/g.43408 Transcript_24542/m.43408 type:complete len:189 (+) Transcript_24542:1803-2369(+)